MVTKLLAMVTDCLQLLEAACLHAQLVVGGSCLAARNLDFPSIPGETLAFFIRADDRRISRGWISHARS